MWTDPPKMNIRNTIVGIRFYNSFGIPLTVSVIRIKPVTMLPVLKTMNMHFQFFNVSSKNLVKRVQDFLSAVS